MILTQGHISEVLVTVHTYPKPCPVHKLSLPSWFLIIISRSRIMTLTQGHIAKVNVTVYTWQFFPRPLPFMGPLDRDDTSHNSCP